MNLRALRVFVGLMDDGTLTRAARHMHLSQSAASRLLSILEGELGTPLFRRERRRMVPLPSADALYPEAARILAQVGALPELVTGATAAPPLRIICQSRLVPALAVPSIARFVRKQSGRRVRLESASRRELARRLLADRHDVAIATLPLPADIGAARLLGTVPLAIALPRAHPLAERERLCPNDLTDVPYVALDESTVVRRMVDAAHPALPAPLIEVSTGAAAYRLVAEGVGFTFADVTAVDPQLADRLVLVPWTGAPAMTIGAVQANEDDAVASAFIATLEDQYGRSSSGTAP